MSNFLFLERQFPELKASMEKAESLTKMDPEMAVIMARKASEQLIKWISMQVNTVGMKGKMVNELLSNNDFKKLVPNEILQKMHEIKNVGNRVIHENYIVDESLAYDVIKNLYQICTWFFSKFSSFDLTIIGNEENIDIGIIEDDLPDFDDEECDFTTFLKYERLSESGNAEALYRLGKCYEFGRGTDRNEGMALSCYINSSEKGYPLAIIKLAEYKINNDKNIGISYEDLVKLDNYKIPEAYFLKGRFLELGQDIKQNHELAFRNYVLASDLGMVEAQVKVGWCYRYGNGVLKNESRAFHYFELASAQNQLAMYELAECYRLGIGVKVDIKEALSKYDKIFNLNYPSSEQNNTLYDGTNIYDATIRQMVRCCFIDGKEIPNSTYLGLEVLKKGLQLNNGYATDRLIRMYESGELMNYCKDNNLKVISEKLISLLLKKNMVTQR